MVIIGAGMNHWFHCDMNYRGIINMLVMCGCVGKSGGGWAHYVGQEKLRPQTGWTALAFALDWHRPPRHMNSTSFFYAHTDQWRYEKLEVKEILSPLADPNEFTGSLIDFNVRAERMGWLPSAPQLQTNPLQVAKDAAAAGADPKDYAVEAAQGRRAENVLRRPGPPGQLPAQPVRLALQPAGQLRQGPRVFPQASAGHQRTACRARTWAARRRQKPEEVAWHDEAPEGKLDLLVTLDFRMSTTCLYSDIVLPTATWYEKNDLNTSDMHPFIHPLSAAVDPVWEATSDWEIYKGIAKKFSEVCVGHLGVEKDLVLTPTLHDTPGELAQAIDVKDWKKGECDLDPRQDRAADDGDRARLPEHVQEVHRARAADGKGRQRRQGHRLEHRARGEAPARPQLPGHRGGRHQGHAADRVPTSTPAR